MKEYLFTSLADDISHQLIISYWDNKNTNGGDFPFLYCSVLLNKLSFWKRLKAGILYIFGKQSKYGYFEEFIFNVDDGYRLKKIGDYLYNLQLIKYKNKYPELTTHEIEKMIKNIELEKMI
jgi:hypothetical protein